MPTPNTGNLIHAPGKLVKDPTDFTATFPMGGTALGSAEGIVCVPSIGSVPLVASEFGTVYETVYTGERWTLSCALREWHDDINSVIFPRVDTGTVTGLNIVEHDHTAYRAGQLQSASSMALLFVSDDPLSVPSIYFKRAIVMLEQTARLQLTLAEMLVFPVMFRAIPPTSGPAVQMGLLEDLIV